MRLLARVLEQVDAEHAAAYLESTNPAKDRRYAAVGFERHGEFRYPGGGPVVTTMVPTAQALSGDEALTASRKSPSGAGGFGLGVRLHRAPFQCRITVWPVTELSMALPTAQAFVAEVAATR